MITVELSIKNRLDITGIVPERSSLVERQTILDIIRKVSIKEPEKEEMGIVIKGNSISWKVNKIIPIEFTSAEITMLKKCVDILDKEKNVTDNNIDICKTILGIQNVE